MDVSYLDSIKFESRRELEELMDVIEKYVQQNPKEKDNETLEIFYRLLDSIHMSW